MKKLLARKDHLLWKIDGIILLISAVCALEYLYAPQIPEWNTAGVFPSIPIGVRFSIAEALVGTFVVVIGGYVFVRKAFQRGRIYIAPPGYRVLAGLFLLVVALSLGVGIVLRAPSLFTEVREFIIPGSLLFVFINLNVLANTEYTIVRVFNWVGLSALVLGVIVFFVPSVIPGTMFTLAEGGFWVVLYAGVFSAVWAAARLLWKGFTWKKSLTVLGALSVFLLWISHKPILFTFLVSLSSLIIAALLSRDDTIVSRARNLAVGLPAILVAAFFLIPQAVKNELIGVFAWRYLKLRNISSVGELQDSFDEVGGGEQDLSAGRFEIWQSYFQDAMSGLGLAPDGMGGAADVYTSLHGYQPGYPAHNTVAYLSYQAGYVAAIAYVLIVGFFLYQGFRYLPRRQNPDNIFDKSDLVAIFAFTTGIIAVGLVGGPLKDYRLAWFFWFGVAVLVRRWSELTDMRKAGS